MSRSPLRLFEGYGIELEYIIVARDSLCVLPIADDLLREEAASTDFVNEVERGEASWSNELVLHLVELKNRDPAPTLAGLPAAFQENVERINGRLESKNAMLMPTGMHPWMDPRRETRLWPHEGHEIYQAFHRVFDCHRHGWANLQSVQLNLSFGDDIEFGRLHAAIRLLLPILSALAASSPIQEGALTGLMDTRLEVYRTNSTLVPSIAGEGIPEPIFSRSDYERQIFEKLFEDIAPHDPEGILRHEWLNARGAIAHFERDAIEIRVLDMQECPSVDVAICAAVSAVLEALVAERWSDYEQQRSWLVAPLAEILRTTLASAEETVLSHQAYLEAFGFPESKATAGELWRHLVEELDVLERPAAEPLGVILNEGTLARRILRALDGRSDPPALEAVYRRLCGCLARGQMFRDT